MKPKRGKIIDRMADRGGHGAQWLAEHADISIPTARKVLAGESVTAKTAIRVSAALGAAPTSLFDLEDAR